MTDETEWWFRRALEATVAYSVAGLGAAWLFWIWGSVAPWLKANQDLAGWAEALGGMLSVAAVAGVAFAESRRSRKLLKAQYELQKAALEHQSRENTLERKRIRNAAIASAKSAHDIVAWMIRCIYNATINPDLIRVWERNLNQAISLVETIQYAHFEDPAEITVLSEIRTSVTLTMRDMTDLCQTKPGASRDLHLWLIKRHRERIEAYIRQLDPKWRVEPHEGYTPTKAEQKAYEDARANAPASGQPAPADAPPGAAD